MPGTTLFFFSSLSGCPAGSPSLSLGANFSNVTGTLFVSETQHLI